MKIFNFPKIYANKSPSFKGFSANKNLNKNELQKIYIEENESFPPFARFEKNELKTMANDFYDVIESAKKSVQKNGIVNKYIDVSIDLNKENCENYYLDTTIETNEQFAKDFPHQRQEGRFYTNWITSLPMDDLEQTYKDELKNRLNEAKEILKEACVFFKSI